VKPGSEEDLLGVFAGWVSAKPHDEQAITTAPAKHGSYQEWLSLTAGSVDAPVHNAETTDLSAEPTELKKTDTLVVEDPRDFSKHAQPPVSAFHHPSMVRNMVETASRQMSMPHVSHPSQATEREALAKSKSEFMMTEGEGVNTHTWGTLLGRNHGPHMETKALQVKMGIKAHKNNIEKSIIQKTLAQGDEKLPSMKDKADIVTHVPPCHECHEACREKLIPGAAVFTVTVNATASHATLPKVPSVTSMLAKANYKIESVSVADVVPPAVLTPPAQIMGAGAPEPVSPDVGAEAMVEEFESKKPTTLAAVIAILGGEVAANEA
jgi:hypothetical protein